MCKMNPNEVMASFNEIVNQVRKGEQTAEQVSKELYAKAAELRAMADALIRLARQLSGNTSNELIGREVIVLKEGERHPKAAKPGRKPKAKKQRRTYVLTEEQRQVRRELCAKMREAKQQKALVEKFAETKIS